MVKSDAQSCNLDFRPCPNRTGLREEASCWWNRNTRRQTSAHVIVLGNEKGGSGKSTIAMHVAVALLKAGQRVATIDLDSRQKSFTHYIENRRAWAKRAGSISKLPSHFCVARGRRSSSTRTSRSEFSGFAEAMTAIEHSHDFIVIDTPGTDSYLMRLAHSMADTLITPLNDSFVDFDVLGTVDPATFAVTGDQPLRRNGARGAPPAPRASIDGTDRLDRGAQPAVDARLAQQAPGRARGCSELALRLGFRAVDGFAERVIYPRVLPARADRARRRSTRRRSARGRACRT